MGDVLDLHHAARSTPAGQCDEPVAALGRHAYQRADAPVDERWVRSEHGEAPVGHGAGSKLAKIC